MLVRNGVMSNIVFFSWQADRSTKEGRNLIEKSLETAVDIIAQDITIEKAVRDMRVDKDTKGVPGSPLIFETILKKIDRAAVFVPDLTFVGTRTDNRLTPNPNVLIDSYPTWLAASSVFPLNWTGATQGASVAPTSGVEVGGSYRDDFGANAT